MRLLSDRAMPTIFFYTGKAMGRGEGEVKRKMWGKVDWKDNISVSRKGQSIYIYNTLRRMVVIVNLAEFQ